MRLLVTRPDEDASPLIAALEAMGHQAFHMPLLNVRHLPDAVIPSRVWQALLITSANGVRALSAHRDAAGLMHLPVYAVGEASAAAARDAGFAQVMAAGGDVVSLAADVSAALKPEGGALLHVAGSVLAGDLKGMLEASGFSVERAVLYEADVATQLPAAGRRLLAGGGSDEGIDGVLFFSPRTATTFVMLVLEAGLGPRMAGLTAFCLSQAVADALAPLTFGRIAVSATPTQAALISLTGRG
tara:strand:+ start:885 stop:1613 length:729 start_codon:yes stop_codon:yes gene_type:complete